MGVYGRSVGSQSPGAVCWVRIAAEALLAIHMQQSHRYSCSYYIQEAGTPLISRSPPGSSKVMRFVSWLTCSTALTFRLCEKIIERGNERVLEGSLYAESSRRGAGRDMYNAVPTTAVAAAVVRTGRRAKMAAMLVVKEDRTGYWEES